MALISGSIKTDTKKGMGRPYIYDNRNGTLSTFLICSKKSIQQIFH
jgi:hypothetical protein